MHGILGRCRSGLVRLAVHVTPLGSGPGNQAGIAIGPVVATVVAVAVAGGADAAFGAASEFADGDNEDDEWVFALANPTPEVHPDVARRHAAVVATGRSDFPNQINNVLVFPGIFRGALAVRATAISEGMKLAAAHAIAELVGDDLSESYVIPSPFDPRVADVVSRAVTETARREGLARRPY